MSAAKKKRELNRAAEECDKRKLSMQFAISQHGMLNLMESVAASEIEELRKQRDELLAVLKEAVGGIVYLAEEAGANQAKWADWDRRARAAITLVEGASNCAFDCGNCPRTDGCTGKCMKGGA